MTLLVVGTSMGNVASTYSSLGMHHEALELKQKVLQILKRSLPSDHPDIGVSLGLINWYHFQQIF
jgi:hypothetical protein